MLTIAENKRLQRRGRPGHHPPAAGRLHRRAPQPARAGRPPRRARPATSRPYRPSSRALRARRTLPTRSSRPSSPSSSTTRSCRPLTGGWTASSAPSGPARARIARARACAARSDEAGDPDRRRRARAARHCRRAGRPSPGVARSPHLAAVALALLLAMRALAASSRRESSVDEQPQLLEQAESRIGRPLELLCPFTLLAQDHCGECWQGRQYLWLGLDEEQLWLLHDAPSPSSPRPAAHQRAGCRASAACATRLPRHGLAMRSRQLRGCQQLELSWPHAPRLLVGRVYGPRAARDRLVGLLAADELGLPADARSRPMG